LGIIRSACPSIGHNPTVHPLRYTLPLCMMICCSSDKDEDTGKVDAQTCESSVELEFPDGTWASFDGCNDVLADATFEFDPDDPPEIRSFRLQLTGQDDPGFDCWLIMTASGICGPGYYDVGAGKSTSVQYAIHDCPYVSDGFEDAYVASEGVLLLDAVNAGSEPGNFTDTPLLTHIKGAIETTSASDVKANVSFDLQVRIRGEDAEEIECDKAD